MGFRPAQMSSTTRWTVGQRDNIALMTHENELVSHKNKRITLVKIIQMIFLFKWAEWNVKMVMFGNKKLLLKHFSINFMHLQWLIHLIRKK